MTTKHHRKPKSKGGEDIKHNISRISDELHKAWHLLFANHHPKVIANIINEIYLDPEWEFIARRKSFRFDKEGKE